MRSDLRRRLWAAAAAVPLGVVVALVPAPAALAHSELVSSSPAAGERLTSPPPRLQLTFGEPVNPQFVTVNLSVAALPPTTLTVSANGPTVTAVVPQPAVRPPSVRDVAQEWTLTYRVVSADGHPVSGSLTFIVDLPGVSTSTTAPESQPSTSAPTSATSAVSAGSPTTMPNPVATPGPQPKHDPDDVKPIIWLLIGASLWVVVGWIVFIRRQPPEDPVRPDHDAP